MFDPVAYALARLRRQPHLLWDTADVIIKRVGDEAWAAKTDTREVIARGTDHAKVIQKAVDEGGIIVLRRGVYNVARSIALRDGVHIVGMGARLVLAADVHLLYFSAKDVGIVGIALEGRGHSGRAIYMYDSEYVRIANVSIKGFNDAAIFMLSSSNVKIEGCILEDSGGITVYGSNVRIANNTIRNLRNVYYSTGIWVRQTSENVVIANNIIDTGPARGIAVAAPAGVTDQVFRNITIVGNIISNIAENGVYTGGESPIYNIIVCRNHVYSSHRGIEVNATRNVVVCNNIVENTTGAGGIYVSSDNAIVIANVVRKLATYGINVSSSYSIVAKNIVESPDTSGTGTVYQAGILIYGQHNKIISNIVKSAKYGIVEVNEADYNMVSGNRLENVTTPIVKKGANTLVKNNWGYTTENSGVAIVVGDGTTTTFVVDVTHGLVDDKIVARVTIDRDGTIDKVYTVDKDGDGFKETLRIQVSFATPPADGENVPIFWHAEVV